jgi:hypothetical protein
MTTHQWLTALCVGGTAFAILVACTLKLCDRIYRRGFTSGFDCGWEAGKVFASEFGLTEKEDPTGTDFKETINMTDCVKRATIELPAHQLQSLQEFLDSPGEDRVATLATFTADFGNGIEADIKVCQGDPPFVDAVLFDNGCEVCLREVSDRLEGEYLFDHAGQQYQVTITSQAG